MNRGLILVAIALVLSACTDSRTRPARESQTHWLKDCNVDDDCGDLMCICNVCIDVPCGRLHRGGDLVWRAGAGADLPRARARCRFTASRSR
jgi:hypothetical protein